MFVVVVCFVFNLMYVVVNPACIKNVLYGLWVYDALVFGIKHQDEGEFTSSIRHGY